MWQVMRATGRLRAKRMRIDPDFAERELLDGTIQTILNAPEQCTTDEVRAAAIRATVSGHNEADTVLGELYTRMTTKDLWKMLEAAHLWKMLETVRQDGDEDPESNDDDAWGAAFWTAFVKPAASELSFMKNLEQRLRNALDFDLRPEMCVRTVRSEPDVVIEPTDHEHRMAMEIAAEYLSKCSPDGLQEYLEAEAEESHSNHDAYNPDLQEFVALKKLLTAARTTHHTKIMEAQDEASERRKEIRRSKGLPLELPARPAAHECPLSQDVMLDPVIAADGVSYERSFIENWLLRGNVISPITRKELIHTELADNVNLRKLIRDYDEVEHEKLLALAEALGHADHGSKRARLS